MARARLPDIPAPIVPTRRPARTMPAGATDCHAHVFGAQDRYPLKAETHFVPHETPWTMYAALLRSLGCERAVLVQPSVYGSDNAAIEHALAAPEGLALRAIAVVAPGIADAELDRLHALGFRGVRINLAAATRGLGLADAKALAPRLRERGWHLQVYADLQAEPALADELARLPLPVVLDHFGRVPASGGLASPGAQALLRLLAQEHGWVKLSAPYFVSTDFPAWADLAPLARAIVQAAPDRTLWGTDWPHASARRFMQADAELADALATWVPDDEARRRVLVDNPARLYGFA